jgi:hypothetical protein
MIGWKGWAYFFLSFLFYFFCSIFGAASEDWLDWFAWSVGGKCENMCVVVVVNQARWAQILTFSLLPTQTSNNSQSIRREEGKIKGKRKLVRQKGIYICILCICIFVCIYYTNTQWWMKKGYFLPVATPQTHLNSQICIQCFLILIHSTFYLCTRRFWILLYII